MTPAQILQAFGQRLETLPQAPTIVWPDQDANPARPYLTVQHVPAIRDFPDLAGRVLWQTGYFSVVIVMSAGDFAGQANTIAGAIMEHFPKTLRFGGLLITGSRLAAPGYTDGTDYRLPVRIDYTVT